MNRSILVRLVSRIVLLLLGSAVIEMLLVSRLQEGNQAQGQLVLVILMMIFGWRYVVPLFHALLRQSFESGGLGGPSSDHTGYSSDLKPSRNRRGSSSKAIISAALSTISLWVVVGTLFEVEQLHGGDIFSLLRAGLIGTGVIAAVAVMLMQMDGLSGKGIKALFFDRKILMVFLVAAVGWWVSPVVLLLVLSENFSMLQYVDVIFPATYCLFPVAALALRIYRGR